MRGYEIYTDGSCLGNPGPGGWSAIIKTPEGVTHEVSGNSLYTTNNQMEMTAVIEALKSVPSQSIVTVYSDSRYVVDAFNKRWINNWMRNGWRTYNGKAVKNKELWIELIELSHVRDVTYRWVKGHANCKENIRCDFLANAQAGAALRQTAFGNLKARFS